MRWLTYSLLIPVSRGKCFGIAFMPVGQYHYISVFVADSHEDAATNEKITADISKVGWADFLKKKNN